MKFFDIRDLTALYLLKNGEITTESPYQYTKEIAEDYVHVRNKRNTTNIYTMVKNWKEALDELLK